MQLKTNNEAMRLPEKLVRSCETEQTAGFTLIEVLVSLLLVAAIIPVIMQGLKVATLAGEVSERKAIAVRVGERVLDEAIVNGQTLTTTAGTENAGPFQLRWTMKNEPWNQLGSLTSLSNPNSVNQTVVNQNLIHQISVDVTYAAQGRDYSVHLSTLINTTPPQ
jgi:prepilin-type N-terminal cleavage/methylation domain-containing protein